MGVVLLEHLVLIPVNPIVSLYDPLVLASFSPVGATTATGANAQSGQTSFNNSAVMATPSVRGNSQSHLSLSLARHKENVSNSASNLKNAVDSIPQSYHSKTHSPRTPTSALAQVTTASDLNEEAGTPKPAQTESQSFYKVSEQREANPPASPRIKERFQNLRTVLSHTPPQPQASSLPTASKPEVKSFTSSKPMVQSHPSSASSSTTEATALSSVIREIVKDSMSSELATLRNDIQNLHIDMIKRDLAQQVPIHFYFTKFKANIRTMLEEQMPSAIKEMANEIQVLREENSRLKLRLKE